MRIDRAIKLEQEFKEEEKLKKRKRLIKRGIMIFIILFIIFLLTFLYARFITTNRLDVNEIKIVDKNLPESFYGFKVLHFTDLHYKTTIDKKYLERLVNKINLLKPDLVVFTGDLTDQFTKVSNDDINDLVNYLNKINSTVGLYAVKGNHDYHTDTFDKVFSKTNFKILDNKYELIYNNSNQPILLNGINSKLENDYDLNKAFSYFNEEDSNQNIFTMTLVHEPDISDEIVNTYKSNLILAGHSHNGQIRLPFIKSIYKVNGSKKYSEEYYNIKNTKLYISSGLGTSALKLRLFTNPSINLYRFKNK